MKSRDSVTKASGLPPQPIAEALLRNAAYIVGIQSTLET